MAIKDEEDIITEKLAQYGERFSKEAVAAYLRYQAKGREFTAAHPNDPGSAAGLAEILVHEFAEATMAGFRLGMGCGMETAFELDDSLSTGRSKKEAPDRPQA